MHSDIFLSHFIFKNIGTSPWHWLNGLLRGCDLGLESAVWEAITPQGCKVSKDPDFLEGQTIWHIQRQNSPRAKLKNDKDFPEAWATLEKDFYIIPVTNSQHRPQLAHLKSTVHSSCQETPCMHCPRGLWKKLHLVRHMYSKNFLEIAGTKLLQRRFSLTSETFSNAETQALSNSCACHP